MSGTAIIRELLANTPAVVALVPADVNSERLVAGNTLKQGVKLPAIHVRSISSTENQTTARNLNTKMIRERVQVTVYANRFPDLERVLKACSMGKGVHNGIVAGYKVRNIWPEYVGPYIPPGSDNIHEQSRDFMVTFIEAN